ncbi:hypothetical protein ACHAXA_007944 [Cyclostephanos tholiformis]|uniref:dCTP pyrophosphatase 1 n=1 Tax=Cyclostephanos tholiformis TaxID=382380 RepID=A0ABD3R3U6_9STRA
MPPYNISSPPRRSSTRPPLSSMITSRVAFSTIEDRAKVIVASSSSSSSSRGSGATVAEARDEIFRLGATVGRACDIFLSYPRDVVVVDAVDDDDDNYDDHPSRLGPSLAGGDAKEEEEVKEEEVSAAAAAVDPVCGEIFLRLFDLSGMCSVDLRTCVLKKMELNGKKYPVELCKGKSGKYTDYSDQTGITTTVGQSTIDSPTKSCTDDMEDDTTVEGITLLVRNFANERQWYRYHTPRNIALAIMGELGELSELFQWLGDGNDRVADVLTEEMLDKVGQEIADVAIYLIRLCDVCHVPLGGVSMHLLDERP